jgi:hypothetical protein
MGNVSSIDKVLDISAHLADNIWSTEAIACCTYFLGFERGSGIFYGGFDYGGYFGLRVFLAPCIAVKVCLVQGDGIAFEVVWEKDSVIGSGERVGQAVLLVLCDN